MSNLSSNLYGSTILDVALPQLSGASPTTYFCGNIIWRQLVQTKTSETKKVSVSIEHPVRLLNSQYPSLHQLVCGGNVRETTNYLEKISEQQVNQVDHNGNTALVWAVIQKQEDFVRILIENNSDLNIQNFAGETALFLSTSFGYDNISALLLENGANPNVCNAEGVSPAHMAAAKGNSNHLKLLSSYGAFMNAQDQSGDTPLHFAIREAVDLNVVDTLITRCNASVDIWNADQETALTLASELGMNEYVQFLLQHSQYPIENHLGCEISWNRKRV
jgi:ankyrin repeat protein